MARQDASRPSRAGRARAWLSARTARLPAWPQGLPVPGIRPPVPPPGLDLVAAVAVAAVLATVVAGAVLLARAGRKAG
jgi:hypothetical protein